MELRIRSVSREDYGGYLCVAKNSLGETTGTIKLYGKLKNKTTVILCFILELLLRHRQQRGHTPPCRVFAVVAHNETIVCISVLYILGFQKKQTPDRPLVSPSQAHLLQDRSDCRQASPTSQPSSDTRKRKVSSRISCIV